MQNRQGINFCFISDKYVTTVLFEEFNISFTCGKVNPDLRVRYDIVVLGICKQRKQRRTLAAHALITHFDVAGN